MKKLIFFAIFALVALILTWPMDSSARETKWSRGTQMHAVQVLRDSTIDTLLINPDDWAFIAKLNADGMLRAGSVDSNSFDPDWLEYLRNGFVQSAESTVVGSGSSQYSDSAGLVSQLPYHFKMFGQNDVISPLIPSQRWALVLDTLAGSGNGRILLYDLTGDCSYFIDSIAIANMIDDATIAVSDSSRVTGQLPYGFSILFSSSFSVGALTIDTTYGYIRVQDFGGTSAVYPESSWVGIRVDNAVASGSFWRTKRLVHQYVNPGLTTVTGVGMPPCTLVTTGSIASGNGSNGPFLLFTTGATSGDSAGLETVAVEFGEPSYTLTRSAWNPEFVARIQTGTSVSDINIWVGLFSTSEDDADPASTHLAAIRYIYGTDTKWKACTKDGSTLGTTTAYTTPVASTVYEIRIALTSTTADFWINDTYIGQRTTYLPSSSQDLGFAVRVATSASAAKTLYFDYASLLQK